MRYLCRLCSSTDKIIDVYHSQLESGEQLRRCILLASGIEILWNDPISRMVCHRCCEIAVKLHKYRSNAVANDKLLKEKYGQPYTAPITDKDELLSTASRIYNLTDIGIMKDDADPLELLNTYITGKSAKNSKGNVTKVKVENVSKVKESVTIKPSTLSPPNQTLGSTVDNVKDKTLLALENDKAAVPLNNAIKNVLPKPQSVIKRDIPKVIPSRSITPNADTEVDKSNTINYRDDKGTQRLSQSDLHPYAHPSVKHIFKEYHSIQLPKEVYSSDISPRISIDPTEVSDWYTQQLQNLKDKLKNMADSNNSNPLNSSDDEDVSRPRLRKRKHKRIIDCSDSDGDDEWLPFKIQAQDVKSTKPTRLVISNSNATARTPEASPEIPNCSNATSDSNYTVVNRSSPPKQPEGDGLKLKIMKHLPPPTATSTESTKILPTDPNARVLKSLLTSNDQTLANLYTDFSKYGINIENSEPPIHYEGDSTSSLTDMVLEAMVGQKPEAIKPVDATVNVNKVNDDVICISDDENDTVDEKPKANLISSINSNEENMINVLLKKHLNRRVAKESQTFHPNDSIIHRTKTNLIALPNMVGELRRYKIPIDLKYSVGNVAHFENNLNHSPHPTLDKWSMEECVNISILKSTPSCTTQTATGLNNGPATMSRNGKPLGSSLWNQMFVDRITNAIKSKCNENLGKSNQVSPNLIKSNQQVSPNTGQPSHITSNLFGNVTHDNVTSEITSNLFGNVTRDNVTSVNTPCVDNEVNRLKPIILNGSNSLSLHSLLYSEKTTVDRPQEPAASNNSTISPLLQNYLQANPALNNGVVPSRESKSENLTATVTQPAKDVRQGDMTSKIRVKNMSELL